ncbi:hypothetical protein AB6A40_007032 [Gnathostoma spinigerum]|uniref:Uncharacterized protein n=1 Tax=Gnathostoma spinigerum TaxID=75299 RepID=A0ABD6ETF5_9BILA
MITKPVGTKDELTQNVLRTSPNDNRTGDVSSNQDEIASGNKKRNVSIIFTTLLCLTVVVIAGVALTTTVTSKAEDVKRVRRDISYQQCRAVCRKEFRIPPLVLISLDGFWAQYLERGLAPNLESVAECGVRAKYMRPVFPTKTFPNHYSIATGLYPESHGIIDNRMWDPSVEGENFKASTTVPGFYLGEPIWNTVIKNGQKSAVFFWPGSEAEVGGLKPTYFMKYNGSVPFSTRVDQIVQWLLLPEDQRPSFVAAYISQPDENGHKYGPFSEKVTLETYR